MGHHLHVWEGPPPHSDLDAHEKFTALAENYLMDGPRATPTPRVAAFVAELLSVGNRHPSVVP